DRVGTAADAGEHVVGDVVGRDRRGRPLADLDAGLGQSRRVGQADDGIAGDGRAAAGVVHDNPAFLIPLNGIVRDRGGARGADALPADEDADAALAAAHRLVADVLDDVVVDVGRGPAADKNAAGDGALHARGARAA